MSLEPYTMGKEITAETILICPYCLTPKMAVVSVTFKKDGHVSNLRKCPICQRKWRASSALREETTVKAYAKWVVDYGPRWFFEKAGWEQWHQKLNAYGWADEFWTEYCRLKPKLDSDENRERAWEDYERSQK
jgi:transcription elongation factor Elf1